MTHLLDSLCTHQGHTSHSPELPQEGPGIPRDQAGAETSLKWLPVDACCVCLLSLTRTQEQGTYSPWMHRLLSDGPFCRICHEGANGESLLSPCGCTGTLGAVHQSCLERWLSSSNTSYCELCHTEFAVEKRPRPLTEWLKDPGPRTEKRTLCCDMVCFLFITPLAAISGWLCLRGAQDHLRLHSRLEAVGLIALTIALFTIYVLWTLVSFRYHCQLYSEWRRTNQKVRLKIRDADGSEGTQHSSLAAGLLKKVAEETPV
uniref:E3 ubiquitin-protein ligase MARCHF2 n=3 Tax=Canis lupus TaxID=9612 RepID=A0A8P0NJX7_CANLF